MTRMLLCLGLISVLALNPGLPAAAAESDRITLSLNQDALPRIEISAEAPGLVYSPEAIGLAQATPPEAILAFMGSEEGWTSLFSILTAIILLPVGALIGGIIGYQSQQTAGGAVIGSVIGGPVLAAAGALFWWIWYWRDQALAQRDRKSQAPQADPLAYRADAGQAPVWTSPELNWELAQF